MGTNVYSQNRIVIMVEMFVFLIASHSNLGCIVTHAMSETVAINKWKKIHWMIVLSTLFYLSESTIFKLQVFFLLNANVISIW